MFGTLADGGVVQKYTLRSAEIELELISYGARVVALKTKDREGPGAMWRWGMAR